MSDFLLRSGQRSPDCWPGHGVPHVDRIVQLLWSGLRLDGPAPPFTLQSQNRDAHLSSSRTTVLS